MWNTVAGDGSARSRGKWPLGATELGGGEESADGLVGGAGVAQSVKPHHEATGGELRRRMDLATEEGREKGDDGDGNGGNGERAEEDGNWSEAHGFPTKPA